MKINSVSAISYPAGNKTAQNLSFKACVSNALIDYMFKQEMEPKLRTAQTQKEKENILKTAKQVLSKAVEISKWDNNSATIGFIPKKNGEEKCGLGISSDTFTFADEPVIVPSSKIKNYVDAFVNIKKEDYIKARTPAIIDVAREEAKKNVNYTLESAIRRIGKDSGPIFEKEYLNEKTKIEKIKQQEDGYDFRKKLKDKLGLK